MSEERTQVLKMVADGKVTVEEAERLLAAMGETGSGGTSRPGVAFASSAPSTARGASPKFLRVTVEGAGHEHVNVKVPVAVIRAGIRLSSLLPPQAREAVTKALGEKGVNIDLNVPGGLKPEHIEELIEALSELHVDIGGEDGEKVRVFFE